ncbi:MAG: type I restriction endonuclease [Cyclobacteriaceae bacterium]
MLKQAGWEEGYIVREYYFTDGRKLIGNKRGKRLFLDYLLKYNGSNLAIVEEKKLGKHPTDGLQQAIEYAQKLKINLVYASNGEELYLFDLRTGKGSMLTDS